MQSHNVKVTSTLVHEDTSTWTHKDIRVRTEHLFSINNIDALRCLFIELLKKGNPHFQAVNDVLFENDRPDLAHEVLFENENVNIGSIGSHGVRSIYQWANDNFAFMVEHCPKTYARWEDGDYEASIWSLNRIFCGYTPEQRVAVLTGLHTNKCEKRLHELLVEYPWMWSRLPAIWAGTPGSVLRQAAMELGWKPRMFLDMFVNNDAPDKEHCAMFQYPYSLFVLAQIIHDQVCQPENPKPDEDYIMCPGEADAQDIALANALMSQAECIIGGPVEQKYVFCPFGALQQTEQKPAAELIQCIHIYTSLDSLDSMAVLLASGTFPFPGMQPPLLELPEFGS